MKKPTEVLFRLHGVTPPADLAVEVINRNDAVLKEQHKILGILPGEKVFETKLPKDGPWRLGNVFTDLTSIGYDLIGINVEIRDGEQPGTKKAVLSLNFSAGPSTCTPAQRTWAIKYLSTVAFRLAQAYLNPRTDGSSQLAYDCTKVVAREIGQGQSDLPITKFLGHVQNLAKTVTVE